MHRGFSLVELLIVAAVMSLFFGGLFVTIQTSLKLVADSRVRMSALSVAHDHVEYIRSLSYDAVGTVSGIPAGAIAQVSTTTLNGFLFTRRVLIDYVDDPADGIGAADTNSITTDYKQVKVEVSWDYNGASESAFLITNVVPRSIETDVGGGTIRVNVFDADVQPVSGASVRLVNNQATTSIDVTKSTDASGVVLFGGAPAQAGYEIIVTKNGYSTDRTNVATGTLANPAAQPFAVVEADVTTMNFFIDELSTIEMRLLRDYSATSTLYTFASTSDLLRATSTTIVADSLVLEQSGGVYLPQGEAMLLPITPSTLVRWEAIVPEVVVPTGTTWRFHVYADTAGTALVPDTDLPGNSSGFSSSVDMSMLSSADYPALTLGVVLETTDTATSSIVQSLQVYYRDSETPHANTAVTLIGSKILGTDASNTPVYKYDFATTTDAEGERLISGIEWDTYNIELAGYVVAEACDGYPMPVMPGTTAVREYVLVPATDHHLRVVVQDALGRPVRDASVTLRRAGNATEMTSHCGQVHFDSLLEAPDYRLEVSAPGYTSVTVDPVSVSGAVVETITL